MKNLSSILLASFLLTACQNQIETVVDEGKGPFEATLLVLEDQYGSKSHAITYYDEEDTIQFTTLHELRAKVVSNSDSTMKYTLFYGDQEVGTLSPEGESELRVVQTSQFEEGGGLPYLFLEVAPSGLGGYILYEVPGTYYRLNTQTLALEQMPALVEDFFGGETAETQLKFLGVGIEGPYENTSGSRFLLTLTNLEDLSTQEFIYETDDFGAAGQAVFSPNGQKVVFTASRNNPDDEMSAVLALDLNTGEVTELERGAEWYDITGWVDEDTPIWEE